MEANKISNSVMEWTIDDVSDWLRGLQLNKYCKRFQNYLVSGPVVLQLDEVLLDDLCISVANERDLLLRESRKLCLKELDMVKKALKYKHESKQIANNHEENMEANTQQESERAYGDNIQMQETENICIAQKVSVNADTLSFNEADEVASRATIMVDMLSRENSYLRSQLEQLASSLNQQVKDETSKLQTEKCNLNNQLQRYANENQQLSKKIQSLNEENRKLQDALGQQRIDMAGLHTEMVGLKQNHRTIRDRYQRLKFKTVEREMSKKTSDGSISNRNTRSAATISSAGDVQLIEKVYQANKRCAELEDTVRWLYKVIVMENDHYLLQNNDDIDDLSEPDWPSLTTWKGNGLGELTGKQNNEILQKFISTGLPTDSEEDIWSHRL